MNFRVTDSKKKTDEDLIMFLRKHYKIDNPNQTFNEDVCKFQMKPVSERGAYTRKDGE